MSSPANAAPARRVPFDETYLERSRTWLQDSELAWLIRAEPAPDVETQATWFLGLTDRPDYAIWGVECEGQPVGVMGIKDIGGDDGAEYFMYIGERSYWRRGIGRWALKEIQAEVRLRGLTWVYGRIGHHNERSMAAHLALGMRHLRDDDDTAVVGITVDEPVH